MSGSAEAWLRFALQDLVQIVVEDVEHQSDRLVEAIHRAKGALALSDKEGTSRGAVPDRIA